MKNITFFDRMKGIFSSECNAIQNGKNEMITQGSSPKGEQSKQINSDHTSTDTASKLNFQLFDIDQVFAN